MNKRPPARRSPSDDPSALLENNLKIGLMAMERILLKGEPSCGDPEKTDEWFRLMAMKVDIAKSLLNVSVKLGAEGLKRKVQRKLAAIEAALAQEDAARKAQG